MAKLDNIDLDMRDADRLGYGVHYGHFKMDHPFTKDKNEPRLAGQKRTAARIKNVYEFHCLGCGAKFTTTSKNRRYCSDKCKIHKSNAFYKAKAKK